MYLQGTVVGLSAAMLAIGLVLVYRANRILNFAQAALGAVAATLAMVLMLVYGRSYALSVAAGIAVAVALSLGTEFFVIRRFARAPRLLLSVLTLALAQVLGLVELAPIALARGIPPSRFIAFPTPFTGRFAFGGVRFTANHIAVLVVAPMMLAGLAAFFRRTRYGTAVRAAAENEERARLFGVPLKRLSLVVWGIAGLLSATATVLRAPILGPQFGLLQGQDPLLLALAAAMLAGMESLTEAGAAAVLITMGQQTVFFAFGRSGLTDVFLLGVVLAGLLVQRRRFSRMNAEWSSWRTARDVRPVPRELARLREVRAGRAVTRLLLLGALLAPPLFLDEAHTNLLAFVLIFAMVGVSLVVLAGWSGNVSLGQWAVAGLGALVAQRLAQGPSPPDFFAILLVAAAAGAAASVVLGLPALRTKGLVYGVTTLAFALAATNAFFQWHVLVDVAPFARPVLFGFIDLAWEHEYYYVVAVALGLVMLAVRNLRRSRFGRNLIALRDNERQALALGVRVWQTRLAAFAISGAIAALAGALYAYNARTIAYDNFPPELSVLVFSASVIGGVGSLAGPILGAMFIRGVFLLLPFQFHAVSTGAGLLLCLWLFPGGFEGIVYALRDGWLRRVAARHRMVVPSLVGDRPARKPREVEPTPSARRPDELIDARPTER